MVAVKDKNAERNGHLPTLGELPHMMEILYPEIVDPEAEERPRTEETHAAANGQSDVRPEPVANAASASNTKAETKAVPPKTAGTKPAKDKSSKRSSRPPKYKYVRQAQLDAEVARLEKLSQAGLDGDTRALDQLRVELDHCPHVWQYLADLERIIEERMIELVVGKNPLLMESFRKRASTFRHEILGGQPASFAAKLAASRAICCWLFCQFTDLRVIEAPDDSRRGKERQLAQQGFESAMRTFYLARKADVDLQRMANA